MTSLDFNFAEPIASYENSAETANMDMHPEVMGSIQNSNYVVLGGRPVKVVEVTHSKPGKHGHAKVHMIGIDIFTGRRYEDVRPAGDRVQVPSVSKKDYTVVNIDNDGYATLLNDETCHIRSDLKLKQEFAKTNRRLIDKFDHGQCQMKATVLKALDEEQIMVLKAID